MTSDRIDPNLRLAACAEVSVNNNLPSPLSERLDQLVTVANEEGASTNRKELVASLILAAPEDGDELMERVVAYRKARAADAGVRGRQLGDVLACTRHPRGPRPRKSA
jgi:hypothetical protein